MRELMPQILKKIHLFISDTNAHVEIEEDVSIIQEAMRTVEVALTIVEASKGLSTLL